MIFKKMREIKKGRIEILTLLFILMARTIANVSPFDYSTVKLVMKDRVPTIFLLTSQQQHKNSQNSHKQKILLNFHKSAEDYYKQYPHHSPDIPENQQKILFVISDPNDGLFTYDQLVQYLGVEQEVSGHMPVIIYLSNNHTKYKLSFEGNSLESETMLRFLKSARSGKQSIFYKSQSHLVTEKSLSKNVKALVGSNFERILRQSQKEHFTLFYNRLDYSSRALKIQFEKAAESLRKNPNIVFCKVNMDKNEIPYLENIIKMNKPPFILFFFKDKSLEPQLFVKIKQYQTSYDFILKWLKQNTEYPWVRSQDVSDRIQQEQL